MFFIAKYFYRKEFRRTFVKVLKGFEHLQVREHFDKSRKDFRQQSHEYSKKF